MKTMHFARIALTLLATLGLASCFAPKTVSTKCAWCKEPAGTYNYLWDQIGKSVVRMEATGAVAETLGTANTMPEAEKLMNQNVREHAIMSGNYYFCSLRCVNAYNASTGIKEKRVRVISHE